MKITLRTMPHGAVGIFKGVKSILIQNGKINLWYGPGEDTEDILAMPGYNDIKIEEEENGKD